MDVETMVMLKLVDRDWQLLKEMEEQNSDICFAAIRKLAGFTIH